MFSWETTTNKIQIENINLRYRLLRDGTLSKMILADKLGQLKALFAEMSQALIAYSGGVDSTLVAKIAYDVLGDRALAVTAVSPSHHHRS